MQQAKYGLRIAATQPKLSYFIEEGQEPVVEGAILRVIRLPKEKWVNRKWKVLPQMWDDKGHFLLSKAEPKLICEARVNHRVLLIGLRLRCAVRVGVTRVHNTMVAGQ